MSVQVLVGDVRAKLAELPDESVQCVVTSPPYFGLRDYGMDGQIGLEETPAAFVATMVEVFREVRRVLRDDGTLWLNLGDSYAGSGRGAWNISDEEKTARGVKETYRPNVRAGGTGIVSSDKNNAVTKLAGQDRLMGLKPKDLIGIPWRVAFALQDDGWYLRQDIIWSKPNPMPESVTDRCTKAHEYLFLLSKSARYHYDAAAIAEAAIGPAGGNVKPPASYEDDPKRNATKGGLYKAQEKARAAGGYETRNKRSVWEVTTKSFPDAHFATFPPDLIEPCILAGCPRLGTVLDPFGGAGTTGLVADRLGRNAILIELNPEYAEMSRRRIAADAGMFACVA